MDAVNLRPRQTDGFSLAGRTCKRSVFDVPRVAARDPGQACSVLQADVDKVRGLSRGGRQAALGRAENAEWESLVRVDLKQPVMGQTHQTFNY